MSDMHEATAAGIRELKALLSAALMIAQARERTRERDLREQERELVAREREVRRRDSGERGLHPQQDAQRHTGGQEAGRKDIPAAEGTPRPGPGYGQDWWEVPPSNQAWRDTTEGREVTRHSTEANQRAWDRTGLGGDVPPNIALTELRDLAESGELLTLARDAQDRHQPTGQDPQHTPEFTKNGDIADLAEHWANALVSNRSARAQEDERVRALGVDPDEIRDASTIPLPPHTGQQPPGQSVTPPVIDPEQVRQDADILAGPLETTPEAREQERDVTAEQALGEVAAHQEDAAAEQPPSTPTVPGRAAGLRRSSRAGCIPATPRVAFPVGWHPPGSSRSPTGTRRGPRAGTVDRFTSPASGTT